MLAENFVELLAQKNLVSPDLIDGLRQRIAQSPEPIPAELFAERLVQHGVLTVSLSEALLRQLAASTSNPESVSQPPRPATSLPPPSPRPVRRLEPWIGENTSPSAPTPRQDAASLPPRPVASLPPPTPQPLSGPPTPVAFGSRNPSNSLLYTMEPGAFDRPNDIGVPVGPKRFSRKKKKANPWDTKLILFGGAGLLILFLVGLFLSGSLLRRNADAMFSEANRAYDGGSYARAIIEYTDYLDAFPNHSGASTARVRRALARIRLLADAKSDWSETLETAKTEIDAVRNEPNFFEESKAELAVLLPKIASGLAEEASKKTSLLHAEHGQQALALIEELLPRSLRPAQQLAEAQFRIDDVRRLLIRDDTLLETEKKLDALLQAPAFDSKRLEECYRLVDALAGEYPGIDKESRFLEMLRNIARTEALAVRPLSAEQTPRFDLDAPTADVVVHRSFTESRVFYGQTVHQEAEFDDAPIVFLGTPGALFGLRASNGRPLWKRSMRSPDLEATPFFVSLEKRNNPARPTVLCVDSRDWSLDRLEAETGNPLGRLVVGEPFFLSQPAEHSGTILIAASTRSGRLLLLTFDDARNEPTVREFRMPQNTDSAPLVDPVSGFVFQFAQRNTLYAVSFRDDRDTVSFPVGQRPSSVRIPPVRFGSNILFVRQTGAQTSELAVFSTEKGILRTIPIRGVVDAPFAEDGLFLALVSDLGEIMLFEQSSDETVLLKTVAQGSVGGTDDRQQLIRFVSLFGRNVWVADRQLTKFEAQLVQSRLLPRESIRRNIITTAVPYRLGNVLVHAFRTPGLGGFVLEAISLDKASVLWETELADPLIGEPQIDANPQFAGSPTLTLHTSGGKAYRFAPETENQAPDDVFQGIPLLALPRGVFASEPLGAVVALRDGFEAWMPKHAGPGTAGNPVNPESPSANRLAMILDPTASEANRFRSLFLKSPFDTMPVAMVGNLLVPRADGQIVLLDPRSGEPAAEPFVPNLSLENTTRWNAPVVRDASDEFLVVENRFGEDGGATLYRVALVSDGASPRLVARSRLELEFTVSNPTPVGPTRLLLIDDRNRLLLVRIATDSSRDRPADQPDEMKIEKTELLPARPVWGPFVSGGCFLWAAEDGKLYSLTAEKDRDLVAVASPMPVGRPFEVPEGILLTSASGTLWIVDPMERKTIFSVETGIRTRVGAVRVGGRIILAGEDGTVYRSGPTTP